MELDHHSVREGYQELGVEGYYQKNAMTYSNPHREIINNLLNKFLFHEMELDKDARILDLCCGSGEVTNYLKERGFNNVVGLDPYTYDLYKNKTNQPCLKMDFKDIANSKLVNEKFDIIFCSFALHLAEPSMLPMILYNLKQSSDNLVIITPHKKPDIKDFYTLQDEYYSTKIRLRYYN